MRLALWCINPPGEGIMLVVCGHDDDREGRIKVAQILQRQDATQIDKRSMLFQMKNQLLGVEHLRIRIPMRDFAIIAAFVKAIIFLHGCLPTLRIGPSMHVRWSVRR